MKIKLLVSRGGPDGSFARGDEIDVPADEAKRMFETDPPQAEPVREGDSPERAVGKTKPEKAVK